MSDTNTNDPVASAPQANQSPSAGEDSKGISLYLVAGISAFIAMAVCISALAVYHARFKERQRFGTVDISGILEASELRFGEIVAKPNMTDADRMKALDLVQQVGPKLDAAIFALQQQCECILLTKAAVMGDGVTDYTDQIRRAVDLADVDVRASQARIREALLNARPAAGNP